MKMRENFQHVDEEKLKKILLIRQAYNRHELTLEEARAKLKEEVKHVEAYEFAIIEQEMQAFDPDECKKEDIQSMLVLFEGIFDRPKQELPKDHPIQCYLDENKKMKELLWSVEDLIQYPLIKNQWLELYEQLVQWKIHLSRKQNQLYSILEKKGFDRPTTTMWTLDNFIRDEISKAYQLLQEDQDEAFLAMQQDVVDDTRDLMEKEETVLYPTSLKMISEEEFEVMKSGDREIGYAFIKVEKPEQQTTLQTETADESDFSKELTQLLSKHGYLAQKDAVLDVCTGKLTLEQINLIYQHMPVDLSYVDENEKVCFYTDTKHRVFPRSKNVIGRDVKNCHPRQSVHIVEEIIEKFRSGEEDSVEFWINKPGIFIYIYYVAVRDDQGRFRGVLEMMQDCTHIRSLEGSRTLLTWSSGKQEEKKVEEVLKEESAVDSTKPLVIDENTKLKDLLDIKPSLKEELIRINPNFKVINTPLARLMLPKATLKAMSERGEYPLDELIQKVKEYMQQ